MDDKILEPVDFVMTSNLSGKERTKTFNVDKKDLFLFNNGMKVQEAFPYLEPYQREFLITGITKEEWQQHFNV